MNRRALLGAGLAASFAAAHAQEASAPLVDWERHFAAAETPGTRLRA